MVIGITSEKASTPMTRDQDAEDLLGGVRRRRDAVRGEHGQSRRLAQPLVHEPLGVQRRAEQPLLDPVAEGLGDVDEVLERPGVERRPAPAVAGGTAVRLSQVLG